MLFVKGKQKEFMVKCCRLFLTSLLIFASTSSVYSQYPDNYIHYRAIPKESPEWQKTIDYYTSDKIDSALFSADIAAKKFMRLKDWESFLFITNFKGQMLLEKKQPCVAIALLEKTRKKVRKALDTLANIEYFENLFLTGKCYALLNDNQSSEKYLLRAALIVEKSGCYPEVLAIVYNTLSQFHSKMKEDDLAQLYFIKAINALKILGNDYTKAISNYIQGGHLALSNRKLKIEYFMSALKNFENGGFTNENIYYITLLNLSAHFTYFQPDLTKSSDYYKKAEEYAKKNHLSNNNLYNLYIKIGDSYQRFYQYEQALPYYSNANQIALQIFGAISNNYLLTNYYLGRLYVNMGRYSDAANSLNTCYRIGKKGWNGRFPHEYSLYREYGRLYSNWEKPDSVLSFAQKMLHIDSRGDNKNINQFPSVIDEYQNILRYNTALLFKIEAYYHLYTKTKDSSLLKPALAHCDYAYRLLEKINERKIYEPSILKISTQNKAISSYAISFALHMYERSNNKEYLKKAVEFYERSKANYLKSMMVSRIEYEQDTVPLKQKDEFNSIEIHKRQNLFSKQSKDDYYSANSAIASFSIDSLQYKIPEKTGILLFHISNYWNTNENHYKKDIRKPQELVAFLIDNNHIKYFTIELNEGESKNILNYIKSIRTGNEPDFIHYSTTLYKMLIAPFIQSLSTKENIVIIPDVEFAEFPFESLLQSENSLPLCSNFATSYHYSMGLWLSGYLRSTIKSNNSFVAFAPDFTEEEVLDFDNSWNIEDSLDTHNRNLMKDESHLTPLPMAKEEVVQIGRIFINKNIEKVKVEYKKTTKKHFIELAEQYNIIHIASHGIADQDDYRNSGIFFTIPEGETRLKEGFLNLNEIYKLNTNADLVVLSACKTSIGEKVKGEGSLALPRGFIYAGVPNVIASLWKINDQKTKDLMVAFYKHLLEDKVSYAEALRRAKLDSIAKGFLPIDWAGFVLIGN